jgi:hypothetical protein
METADAIITYGLFTAVLGTPRVDQGEKRPRYRVSYRYLVPLSAISDAEFVAAKMHADVSIGNQVAGVNICKLSTLNALKERLREERGHERYALLVAWAKCVDLLPGLGGKRGPRAQQARENAITFLQAVRKNHPTPRYPDVPIFP